MPTTTKILSVLCLLCFAVPSSAQVFLPPAAFQDEARAKLLAARKPAAEAIRILVEAEAAREALRHQRVLNRLDEAEQWRALRAAVREEKRRNHRTYLDYLKRRAVVRQELAILANQEEEFLAAGLVKRRRVSK